MSTISEGPKALYLIERDQKSPHPHRFPCSFSQARDEIKTFLESELRLKLSEQKTRITHVNDGFDFLGFSIQRRKPEGRWVTHLRPAAKSVQRVKAKVKELTSRSRVLVDEVEQLHQLNAVVRGWCEYYRHTSLQDDLEQVSRYTWHRYHAWLRKKHPGSRKCQLIQQSSLVVRGRQRWTATRREGSRERFAYQWLPSPRELHRTRYWQKGRDGFAHPYLDLPVQRTIPLPRGEKGPPEEIYRVTGRPPTAAGGQPRNLPDGEPDASKGARPVR